MGIPARPERPNLGFPIYIGDHQRVRYLIELKLRSDLKSEFSLISAFNNLPKQFLWTYER